MPAYDAIRFTPPAPLALVTIRNSATGASASDVPMLLDSGADVSLAPRQAVLPLGVSIDPAAVHVFTVICTHTPERGVGMGLRAQLRARLSGAMEYLEQDLE